MCSYLPGIRESDAAVDFLPVFAVLADEDDGLEEGGVLLLRLLRDLPVCRLLVLLARLEDRFSSGRCRLMDSSSSLIWSANAC